MDKFKRYVKSLKVPMKLGVRERSCQTEIFLTKEEEERNSQLIKAYEHKFSHKDD